MRKWEKALVKRDIQVNSSFEAASAAQLVQKASKFKSRISLVAEEKTANAKSIMGIISMDLQGGKTVTIVADGEDEQQALPELETIIGG